MLLISPAQFILQSPGDPVLSNVKEPSHVILPPKLTLLLVIVIPLLVAIPIRNCNKPKSELVFVISLIFKILPLLLSPFNSEKLIVLTSIVFTVLSSSIPVIIDVLIVSLSNIRTSLILLLFKTMLLLT